MKLLRAAGIRVAPARSVREGILVLVLATAAAAACAAPPEMTDVGEPDAAATSDAGVAGDAATDDARAARDASASRDDASVPPAARDAATALDDAAIDGGDDGFGDGGAVRADAALADAGSDAASLGFDCKADDAGVAEAGGADLPMHLACTGLYDDWPARHVAPQNAAYDPGLHLWSDGADKSRWIHLPPGTRIDTSNMDEWTFPVGTRVWKEFRLSGARVETRVLWKRTSDDWVYATYAWSQDGTTATRLDAGALNVFGTSYEIPSRDECPTCHEGRIDFVLGFEAVSLASPGASGLTLATLVARGLVTTPPAGSFAVPGTGAARASLAWLHANCGTACHNRSPNAFAGPTGLYMRLEVAQLAPGTVQATDTYQTSVGQPSSFQPGPDAGLLRIAPGDVAHSAIPFRDGTRDDQGQDFQMPPIDTHVVDATDVAQVKAWIAALPRLDAGAGD
jgi:hypothetical protein